MIRRILLLVPGLLLLAAGIVSAADATKTTSRSPQPGDFHITFGIGTYNGPVALVGANYQWKKSGQAIGLSLLHGQLNSVSGTTDPFRVGCKTYTRPFVVDDRPTTGVMLTYSVKVGG